MHAIHCKSCYDRQPVTQSSICQVQPASLQARTLLGRAASGSLPGGLATVVNLLAACLRKQLNLLPTSQHNDPTQSTSSTPGKAAAAADVSVVAAEALVAVLLQGAVEGVDRSGPGRKGSGRRNMWWRCVLRVSYMYLQTNQFRSITIRMFA